MHTEASFERRGHGPRPPFRRRKSRHPGLAEREAPREIPKPKGEIPAAFADNVFGLVHPLIQHAVADQEYLTPTPIQQQSIPHLLEGRDLFGCAQTGTGKTAAFLLPILHRLHTQPKPHQRNRPRALILAPTRELAAQIAESVTAYGRFTGIPFAVVFGGVSQYPQVSALNRGATLVVATPGRLLDLMEQGHISLESIEEFVLDEADRMLDMGFLPDIKRILSKLPQERHSQFFSATLSPDVLRLAKEMVKDPVQVTISPDQPTVDKINQKVMFVDKPNKDALLIHLLGSRPEYSRVIVFARTRHGSDKIVKKLRLSDIRAEAIHSDKTQRARTDALNAFRSGRVRVLVATDIASRGIDVDGITHVINFDLPEESDSYVHRIGRTARAGADGCAISFVSAEERGLLRGIERMIKKSIESERVEGFHSERAEKSSGRGVPDDLPRPPWAGRKRGPMGRSEGHGQRRDRPGSQGRRQPDFRREAAPAEGAPEPQRQEPAQSGRKWFKPFQKSVPALPAERVERGADAPAREGPDDRERPPRLDEPREDRSKRPAHKPGDRPRSNTPRFGQGHQHEGGGASGHKKPRSSRPPWMR